MLELLNKKELALVNVKTYKKDQILFRENDNCFSIGFVKKGSVVIKSFSNNGKEIIYNTINEGQMFGSNLLFSKNKKYRGDVIAIKDSEIVFINKKELLTILKENEAFLTSYLTKQANTTIEFNSKIKLLSLESPLDRLMYYLEINNNEITIESVTSLSKELNIQRETLSRLLSKLKKENRISYIKKTIRSL